jgi:hypothetical protein
MIMGDGDAPPRLPALDLTCRVCGAVVEACTKCGLAFCEHSRVRCRRDAGHTHESCIEPLEVRSSSARPGTG